ncbi:MAG: hypothetical protein Q8L00_02350 [Deltaproteobacteria bacterium]|nr:hypothetical protein [Deltaproteobacteria bacterium]
MRKFLIIICLFLPSLAMAQSKITLNAVEKKQLNTFFSNFSEADVKSFKQNSLTRAELLNFALDHIYKNADKSLKRSKDGSAAIIPAALVDKTTEKYFGQKIQKHEKSEYLVPLASGESYRFSQITGLLGAGKDLFQAEGVIYVTGSGGTPDPHGTPEAWKKAGEEVEQLWKFSALIKQDRTGKERYVLLEYHVVMNNP